MEPFAFIEVSPTDYTPPRTELIRLDAIVRVGSDNRGHGIVEYAVGNEARVMRVDEASAEIMRRMGVAADAIHGAG